ncbi:MAG: response regulator transcription factor [Bacteroidia bacterium]|nr:response regulator transcription factor [Bacteroidia bacterium]
MIRSIIIENDTKQSKHLLDLLEKHFPEIEIANSCTTIPEGIKKVNEIQPDLIFLDVELPPYTGFDLLEQTRSLTYEVIFMTAHNKYAVKAIKFSALDFLEKPYSLEDLKLAIEKYKGRTSQTGSIYGRESLLENLKQPDAFKRININFKGGFESVLIENIILLESKEGDSYIVLTDGKQLISSKPLNYYTDLLSEYSFCRTHSRYLVNLNHVKKYQNVEDGGLIELTNSMEADVSRKWKEDFLSAHSKISIGKLK